MPLKSSTHPTEKGKTVPEAPKPISENTDSITAAPSTNPAVILQRTHLDPHTLTAPQVLQLQRTIGNQATSQHLVQKNPQRQENATGLPDNLKSGVEGLSGMGMDDVKVHYNSPQPAQIQALAYTQGPDIYVGPGQEKHLPHEAWHVVQQKEGRVTPTVQLKDKLDLNDNQELEQEATQMGEQALAYQGEPAEPLPAQPLTGRVVQEMKSDKEEPQKGFWGWLTSFSWTKGIFSGGTSTTTTEQQTTQESDSEEDNNQDTTSGSEMEEEGIADTSPLTTTADTNAQTAGIPVHKEETGMGADPEKKPEAPATESKEDAPEKKETATVEQDKDSPPPQTATAPVHKEETGMGADPEKKPEATVTESKGDASKKEETPAPEKTATGDDKTELPPSEQLEADQKKAAEEEAAKKKAAEETARQQARTAANEAAASAEDSCTKHQKTHAGFPEEMIKSATDTAQAAASMVQKAKSDCAEASKLRKQAKALKMSNDGKADIGALNSNLAKMLSDFAQKASIVECSAAGTDRIAKSIATQIEKYKAAIEKATGAAAKAVEAAQKATQHEDLAEIQKDQSIAEAAKGETLTAIETAKRIVLEIAEAIKESKEALEKATKQSTALNKDVTSSQKAVAKEEGEQNRRQAEWDARQEKSAASSSQTSAPQERSQKRKLEKADVEKETAPEVEESSEKGTTDSKAKSTHGGKKSGSFTGEENAVHLHLGIGNPHIKLSGTSGRIDLKGPDFGGMYACNRCVEALEQLVTQRNPSVPGAVDARTKLEQILDGEFIEYNKFGSILHKSKASSSTTTTADAGKQWVRGSQWGVGLILSNEKAPFKAGM